MDKAGWFALAGGAGLFLYGLQLMAEGMETAAAGPLRSAVTRLVCSVPRGILAGALLTGAVQSSAAVTLLAIGLAGAGLIPMAGAAGVVMGANVGTTVTAQLLRFSDSGGAAGPALLAQAACFAGAGITLFCKKGPWRAAGQAVLGFGLLFSGLGGVRQAAAPLGQSPAFLRLLSDLRHPLPGVAVGALSSMLLQSSSAAVGLLQALAGTGAVRWGLAVPVVLGQNLGACATPLLAARAGGTRAGLQCARFHLLFNLLGGGACLGLLGLAPLLGLGPLLQAPAGPGGIANFHTLFNLGTTLLLAPFAGRLLALTGPGQEHRAQGPDRSAGRGRGKVTSA